MSESAAKEEKRRRKMLKKMRRILLEAWNHPGSEPFQSGGIEVASLKQLGQSVEEERYYIPTNHRQGWEDFARDMGIVYNYHIVR